MSCEPPAPSGVPTPRSAATSPARWPDRVRFEVQGQRIESAYTLNAEGLVVVDGDMVLGRPERLFPAPDALASNVMMSFVPFPSATIEVAFDTDLTADQQKVAKRALNIVSSLAPVQFTRLADGTTGFSGIRFRSGDLSDGWCTSELGYQGAGNPTKLTMNGCGLDDDGDLNPGSEWQVVHELGHALGLRHEHQRTDASAFVDYDASCVNMPGLKPKGPQFDPEGIPHGPYDVDSIMQYDSYTFAERGLNNFEPDAVALVGDEFHLAIDSKYHVGTTSPVFQDAFDPAVSHFPLGFVFAARFRKNTGAADYDVRFQSIGTVGTEYGLEPTPGTTPYTLRIDGVFLETLAPTATTLDFTDPANWTIEAPNDQKKPGCPVLLRAGTTFADADAALPPNTFLHTPGALSALWDLYGDTIDRSGTPAAGDRFGTAFTFGDFDGDTLPDLAIADPVSTTVTVYRGGYRADQDTGEVEFLPVEFYTAGIPSALAAGDFNGDGYDDLAIGMPDVNGGGGVTVLMGADTGLEHGRDPVAVHSEQQDQWSGTGSSPRLPYMSGDPPTIWSLSSAQAATLSAVVTPGMDIHYFDPENTTSTSTTYTPALGTDWYDNALAAFSTTNCDKAGAIAALFTPGAQVGYSLHVADLNHDGLDDLLVGAPGAGSYLEASHPTLTGTGGSKIDLLGYTAATGAVLVLVGQVRETSEDEPLKPVDLLTPYTATSPTTNQPLYRGSHTGGRFGHAITTHDLDADGCADVVVGAPQDFGRLGTGLPAQTDGNHVGGPFRVTTRPGRVFRFTNGLEDGVCLSEHPSADVLNSANVECQPVFAATLAHDEPNQENGAEFGYAVEAGNYSPTPRVFVGAPGTDLASEAFDAGVVWVFRPGVVGPVDRIDETPPSSPQVAGYPPDRDDRFGSSLAYRHGRGLLVGVPGNASGRGAVDWFQVSGGLLVPSPVLWTSGLADAGFVADSVFAHPTGARLGEQVAWVDWEGGAATGPGIVAGAPGAISALPVGSGAVVGIRGSGTLAGSAWSTNAADRLRVTR